MREGKAAERILKRSVLAQLHNSGPLQAGSQVTTVHLVEGQTLAPQRAVYDAVNAIAASGAEPEGLAIALVMPEEMEEGRLRTFMKETDRLCGEEGISLLSGHTAVSPYVEDLIVTVTALGRRYISGETSLRSREMDVVCAGQIARAGTAMMALRDRGQLLTRYPSAFIDEAARFFDQASMTEAARIIHQHGAVKVLSVREGGIFGGLWQLAAAAKVGLLIDLPAIPVRQHSIEICEFFQINPYLLMSGGCLICLTEDGSGLVEKLKEKEIYARVIGKTRDDHDRLVCYDGQMRFLEPPKQDEYYRYLKNHS